MIDILLNHIFTTTVNLNLPLLQSNRNKFWAGYTYTPKQTEGCYPVNVYSENVYD